MKINQYLIAASLAITATVASMFNYQPVAHGNSSSPPSGYVGAPVGNGNCTSCHSGTLVANSNSITVSSTPAGPFTTGTYVAGQAYTITYTLAGGTKYGFEMACLTSTNTQAGTFAVTNATTTSLATASSRQYIGHKSASATATWSFTWTAPAATAGTVTFYTCGNLANGNGSDSGDKIHSKSWSASPAASCSMTASASVTSNYNGQQITCNGAANGSVTASAAGGTSPYTYTWSNGGTTATASNLAAGTYTVTVRDAGTCSATASVTIAQPTALAGATASTTATCGLANGSASVTATGGTGSYSYQWNTIPAQTTATASNIAAGTYAVTITDVNGCSLTKSVAVSSNGLNTPVSAGAISGSVTPCTVSTSYSVANVSGTTYNWAISGGGVITSSTSNSTSIGWTTPGTYTVSVTPSNTCGTGPTSTLSVTVSSVPSPAGTITGNITPCAGSNTYSVTNVSGVTYNWAISGGGIITSSTTNTTSIGWTTPGTYTVSVTPSNACGNAQLSSTLSVIVAAAPSTTTITGSTSVCPGAQAYSVPAQPGVTYNWSIPNGHGTINPSTGTNVTVTWNTAGTDTVLVAATNTCGTTPNKLPVSINSGAPSTPTISGSGSACIGGITTYKAPTVAGVTYTWALGNGGTLTPHGDSATVAWSSAGFHNISATPTNGCGTGAAGTTVVNVETNVVAQPAAITGDTIACLGASTYSVPLASGITYTWAVSGGGTVNGPTVTWTTPGTYTLSVTAGNSCTVSAPRTLTVKVGALTTMPIFGDTTTCQGAEPYSVLTEPGVTYTWAVSSGGTLSNNSGSNVTITWASTGAHTISVTPTNRCGGGTVSKLTVVVTNGALTTPIITGPIAICTGNTANYSVPAASGVIYNWAVPNGGIITSSTTNLNSIVWTVPGTYTISVTPSNGCGTGTTSTLSVTVTATPVVSLGGASQACVGDTVILNAGAGTGSYAWSTGATSQAIRAIASGTYSVTVTSASCTATASQVVTFNPLPMVGFLPVTTICDSGILDAGLFNHYLWNTGDTTQTISPDTAGLYHVTVTDANGCSATAFAQVVFDYSPVASFTVALSGYLATFTNTSFGAINSLWSFGDGVIDTANSPIHSYLADGTYIVSLVATDNCGTDTITDTVTVLGVGIANIANQPNLQVYPNPASNQLTVTLKGQSANLEILNTIGEKIYVGILTENMPSIIDISANAAGIYILRLTNGKQVYIYKVVKQ